MSLQIFQNLNVHTTHFRMKDSDSVRRDGIQDSGFLASSQGMEMLLDKGLSFEYQNAGLLLGWGPVKHFTYSKQRFRGDSGIFDRVQMLTERYSDFLMLTILKIFKKYVESQILLKTVCHLD